MALVLGIESSCDEAAVALVHDGSRVAAEAEASQADDFAAWGGVVPELAARGHIAALPGLIERVLASAGARLEDIAAVAVCAWPGLIGSLLSGVTAGKVIAARLGIPLIAVDHIQAHLGAIHLGRERVAYPLVGLVASGGHSHLYHCSGPGEIQLIGGTIDDAAGEAFDKAAAMLGLGYPGGPAIERCARGGDARALALPRSFRNDDTLRFSFAGVKTALLYRVRGPLGRDALALDERGLRDACASFQLAIVDCLVAKLLLAADLHQVRAIAVGGGVACNTALRSAVEAAARGRGLEAYLPEPRHCADNGAMIASLGYFRWRRGEIADLDLAPLPTGRVGPRARPTSDVRGPTSGQT
ncbi:MAG: tRNA (adenosine(37)-N6)-threonylcarbamoyltransferase complex transferase subunit TsaD [Planctomycetes bacterium]|nr:tRNA (adenosine(37)-N6)-threonylcarbamoyltransferase complex transferase subunit TsaD [Planctomycetota bacterium]